jgi:hypothetical protein
MYGGNVKRFKRGKVEKLISNGLSAVRGNFVVAVFAVSFVQQIV